MEELIDIKFGNMESKEEEPLSIISTGNILGKIIEVEQQIGDNANLVEEINLDDKSERSVVSRQDVSDMIMENNNMLMLRINDRFDDVNNRFKRMDNRFDNMNEKFDYMVNTIHIMMAKLQGTSFQAVSNDKLLSDHIGNFIKDPNVIENNARQLMEPVQSVVVEVARANSMLPTIEDLISHEVSDTMDNEEIEVVFIRCEDVETSVQHNPSIDISTDVDTLIQENLFQLCNNMSLDMKDSMLIIIPDNDTDKVLDNTDGLDDMDISDAYTMDISDAYKVEVISYDYALESHSGNTNDFHIVEISNITSSEVLNGHGQLAHPVIRFVDQRRVFDPGGITPQFQNIQ